MKGIHDYPPRGGSAGINILLPEQLIFLIQDMISEIKALRGDKVNDQPNLDSNMPMFNVFIKLKNYLDSGKEG